MPRNDRFLNACRLESVDATPVWLMRQAGRFMSVYRALRAKHTLLEMIKTPDLAVEVTLQPVHAFEVDAAIIFADILPLLEAMGMDLEFVAGEGPVLQPAIRKSADVDRLVVTDPEETLGFTLEAIRLTRQELDGRVPLIGFSGAPFTLACYAIEGKSSRDFARTKAFFREEPAAWHALMEKLADAVTSYLTAQIHAGAQAVQLFDSWAKALTPAEYEEFVEPYSRQVFERIGNEGVPAIHFSTAPWELVPRLQAAGGDVISLGPGIDLQKAWAQIGHDTAIQGNLDPDLLADGSMDAIKAAARDVLDQAEHRNGHIFNLGHGVLKHTPEAHVRELVDFVHAYSARSIR